MKTMSGALKAHYALGTTTLTTCWRATLTNGTVVAATRLDRDIEFDSVSYLSATGFNASDIASSAELNPDNLEIEGFLASPAITDADIHSGIWDYAEIEVFEVNYLDLSMGKNVVRCGTLGEVRGGRSKFVAELRGLQQAYSRQIGRLYKIDCDTDLGGPRCKKDLEPLTVTGTVGSVASNRIVGDAARTEAVDWFTAGKLTFTSGLNAGLSMEVKASAVGSITLHQPMPFAIAVGDTYSVYAGCTKRFTEDCIGKHDNAINFQGFPQLPGAGVYEYGGEFTQ